MRNNVSTAHLWSIAKGAGIVLQLHFMKVSESMGNHDSNVVDACCVD
jgi:hypothetical protein